MKVFRLAFALIWITGSLAIAQKKESPYVVLVSFDACRYDYVEKFNLPNFKEFIKGGVSSAGIIPCFPSMTFPNHYSIVTGMYPGNHGLVDNQFFDPATGETYNSHEPKMVVISHFYGGVPLWTLARRNGIKAASYFWVGSEQSDPELRPDYYFPYKDDEPFEARISQVIGWLRLPEAERPHFITLYFSEPDHNSHDTGPWSEITKTTLSRMDSLLGVLMKGIRQTGLPVNTILVSDHGMSEITIAPETYVFLGELFNINDQSLKVVSGGTLAHIYVKDKRRVDSMYQVLKKKEDNFSVYRQSDFPERWHYQNPKSGDIIIIPGPYHLLRRGGRAEFVKGLKVGNKRGDHGFDPAVVHDMYGIFYADGPNIKPGTAIPAIRNIDVYPLVAAILGIKPPPIDGDFKALKGIYKK